MYGLVNRAVEDLVVSLRGSAGWRRVCELAGCNPDGFVAMKTYPDALTYHLVEAAAQELDMAPEAVLKAFGEYWILYTAQKGYGEMFEVYGANTLQFLRQLNEMHGRVESIFPEMTLPHFEVDEATVAGNVFELVYTSPRAGLAPFVEGLVVGLGKRFNEALRIEHVARRDAGAPADRFRIEVLAR